MKEISQKNRQKQKIIVKKQKSLDLYSIATITLSVKCDFSRNPVNILNMIFKKTNNY